MLGAIGDRALTPDTKGKALARDPHEYVEWYIDDVI